MKWLAGGLCIGVALAGLLGGCNAVLGIDEAHLSDATAGAMGQAGTSQIPANVYKVVSCDAVEATCTECLDANCGTKVAACAASPACRNALGKFRECLSTDPNCNPGDDSCWEQQIGFKAAEDPTITAFLECGETCLPSCERSNLVSLCQLYCGCLQANCSDKLPADCIDSCTKTNKSDIYCRLDHCEFAGHSLQSAAHCQHAIGIGECPRQEIRKNCANAKASGLTCSKNSDCCSDDCEPDTEICN